MLLVRTEGSRSVGFLQACYMCFENFVGVVVVVVRSHFGSSDECALLLVKTFVRVRPCILGPTLVVQDMIG